MHAMLSAAEPARTPDHKATSERSRTPNAWTYSGINGIDRPKPIIVKNCVSAAVQVTRSQAGIASGLTSRRQRDRRGRIGLAATAGAASAADAAGACTAPPLGWRRRRGADIHLESTVMPHPVS